MEYFTIFILILIIVFLLSNLINYIYNGFEITITIKDKYIYTTYSRYSSSPNYVIVDTNNNIYNIDDVWFIGDFNDAEDYNSIKIGQTYKVQGYGFRLNFLKLYPTIYKITPV
jgi:hypothetical protein